MTADKRITAITEAARRRIVERKRIRAEMEQRRRYGLRKRHQQKLARLRESGPEEGSKDA